MIKLCNKCRQEKPLEDFYKSKVTLDGRLGSCKKCHKDYNKKRYLSNNEYFINYQRVNREKISSRAKKYYSKHKKTINKSKRRYFKELRKRDPMYRIKSNTSRRIRKSLSCKRGKSVLKYLNTSIKEYKKYLESLFTEGMSWDNYGEWHIDHIIPLASAKTKEDLVKLFDYRNTQPLWAEDNLKKSDKVLEVG